MQNQAHSAHAAPASSLDPADLEVLRPTLTRMARIAKSLFGVSAADVTLFDKNGIWRASDAEGQFHASDPASEIAVQGNEAIWVADLAQDARFADHPMVSGGLRLRFYAGAPIVIESGQVVGALGVFDQTPAPYDAKRAARLIDMAGVVANDFDRVRANRERAAALEQMARSEERFRIAIQGAGLHVYEMDYVNRALFKAGAEDTFYEVGRTYQDLYRNIWLGVHPDDRARAMGDWDRAMAEGKRWQCEYRVARADGAEIWSQSTAVTIQDDNGRVLRLIGAMQNITDRKRSEAAVQAAKMQIESDAARLEFALDAADGAAWEIDLAAGALIGGDQLGRLGHRAVTLEDFRGLTEALVYPPDRALARAFVEALARGGRQDVEYRIARADGSIGWLRTVGRAMGVQDGLAQRLIFLTTDITDRKRAEQEFGQSMRQAAAALRSKRSLLAAIARDIAMAEPGAQTPPEEAEIGSLEVADTTNFSDLYERLSALLAEIDARDQALVSAVESLRGARAAAEAANVAKSQFLAMMSHELRTPLNAVIGYAEILEEDLAHDGKSQGAEDAQRIYKAARNLLELINEVLDFSKIEAGRMEIKPALANVKDIVDGAIETARHLAEMNNNRIEVFVDPSIETRLLDEARLRQCLLNLVSNACKFTQHGSVALRVRPVDDDLIFEVEDTGCGIEPEQAARLFQPFVQADGSLTRKQGGTGLGLVITRKLAQLMGGDVAFKSVPGAGTTFTMRMAAPAHDEEICDSGVGPIVAVIEDDRSARDLVRRALAHLPVRVRCARNGAEGAALARDAKPALIVLDIFLPDRSGWDLLRDFKADPALADVPVLILTIDDDRTRALNMGACEHLMKPVDRERFAAAALRQLRLPRPDLPSTDPSTDKSAAAA